MVLYWAEFYIHYFTILSDINSRMKTFVRGLASEQFTAFKGLDNDITFERLVAASNALVRDTEMQKQNSERKIALPEAKQTPPIVIEDPQTQYDKTLLARIPNIENQHTKYLDINIQFDKHVSKDAAHVNKMISVMKSFSGGNVNCDEFMCRYFEEGGIIWDEDKPGIALLLWNRMSTRFREHLDELTTLNNKIRDKRRCFSGTIFCCVFLLLILTALAIGLIAVLKETSII